MATTVETTPVAAEPHDVFPINGTDYIEFYVGNAKQASHYYRAAFGFQLVGYRGPETGTRDRASWLLQQVMRVLSFGIRRKSKLRRVSYSFLFMRASGEQLSKITALIEGGVIRPVIDRVFQFEATNEALAYVETGRSKGKVVVKVQ